jgi:hypothetical protein
VLTFKEYTVCEEDFYIVDWHHKSKIPIVKAHEHPFGFHDICISWTLILELRHSGVVPLHVIYENEMVIDFVVFGCDKETGSQEDGYYSWTHRLYVSVVLGSFIQEVPVQQFDGNVSCLVPLGELFAHIEKSLN